MNFLSCQQTVIPIDSKTVFDLQKRIAMALKRLPVLLLILHGSVAKDEFKNLSDVDFAVMFKDKYTLKHMTKVRNLLCDILKREDIDMAVLNPASPLLWMQVLSKGKLVYAANKHAFVRFRELAIRRYLQTKHLRTQFHEYQKQAILRKA